MNVTITYEFCREEGSSVSRWYRKVKKSGVQSTVEDIRKQLRKAWPNFVELGWDLNSSSWDV